MDSDEQPHVFFYHLQTFLTVKRAVFLSTQISSVINAACGILMKGNHTIQVENVKKYCS